MIDPICGMEVEPGNAGGEARLQRANLLFLQPALSGEVQGRSGEVPEVAGERLAHGHGHAHEHAAAHSSSIR